MEGEWQASAQRVLHAFHIRAEILSVVTPPCKARRLAPWMTGPSAVGPENGKSRLSIRFCSFHILCLHKHKGPGPCGARGNGEDRIQRS